MFVNASSTYARSACRISESNAMSASKLNPCARSWRQVFYTLFVCGRNRLMWLRDKAGAKWKKGRSEKSKIKGWFAFLYVARPQNDQTIWCQFIHFNLHWGVKWKSNRPSFFRSITRQSGEVSCFFCVSGNMKTIQYQQRIIIVWLNSKSFAADESTFWFHSFWVWLALSGVISIFASFPWAL